MRGVRSIKVGGVEIDVMDYIAYVQTLQGLQRVHPEAFAAMCTSVWTNEPMDAETVAILERCLGSVGLSMTENGLLCPEPQAILPTDDDLTSFDWDRLGELEEQEATGDLIQRLDQR